MTAPEALYQSTLSSLKLRARGKVRDIYDIDDKEAIRVSYRNPEVIALYEQHLEAPLSEKAINLLHRKKQN